MANYDKPGEGFGCQSCWPPDAGAAWEARRTLTSVTELIDESHFHVMVLGCPACAQRFVSVFTESIDWADGDDPQSWTVLPLTAEESAGLLRQRDSLTETELNALGPGRRCLRRDYPKAGTQRVFWGTSFFVGPHD